MTKGLLEIQLLAQSNRFLDMGRNFRQSSESDRWPELLLLLSILVAVGVLVWSLVRYVTRKQRRGYTSPRALFYELCEAHKLDRRERNLLQSVCQFFRLRQPACVFVQPEYFDAQRLSGELQKRSELIAQLRVKLFGEL